MDFPRGYFSTALGSVKNVDNLIELLDAISHSPLNSSDLIMPVLFSSLLNEAVDFRFLDFGFLDFGFLDF